MKSANSIKSGSVHWLYGLFLLLITFPIVAQAVETFPKHGWQDRPNPIASSDAITGGEIAIFAGQYPKSLNYYLDNNSFTVEVFGAMFETLLSSSVHQRAIRRLRSRSG